MQQPLISDSCTLHSDQLTTFTAASWIGTALVNAQSLHTHTCPFEYSDPALGLLLSIVQRRAALLSTSTSAQLSLYRSC